MRDLRLLFIVILLGGVSAQSITNAAMKIIFKYADPAAVDKLTTAINKDKTTAAQIKRVKSWIETNLIRKGAKVPKGAIEGNKAATLKRVTGFLNHRASLHKLIDKLYASIKTMVPTATITAMKKLLWRIDKERNNDLTKTEPEFNNKVDAVISKNKQSAVIAKMLATKKELLSTHPSDAKNLQWTFKVPASSG